MMQSILRTMSIAAAMLGLAACADPGTPRPPLVNSGSYDWQDAFRGPDGRPLPGYAGYLKTQSCC